MYSRYYTMLQPDLDPQKRITILLTSQDRELGNYFDSLGAMGSTDMDIDGNIYVKIHDAAQASKAVWLEELAHALQFIRNGNVQLSVDHKERSVREIEVAECLLEKSKRLRLTESDIRSCQMAIKFYKGEL